IEGIRFARYVPGRNASPLREAWWSDEQALAARFRAADGTGSMDFKIERVRAGVNPEVLRRPAERFPSYRALSTWPTGWSASDLAVPTRGQIALWYQSGTTRIQLDPLVPLSC
ncbi:MAG TPA: hypothetical protein VFO85_15425, partial [Vicinamibacteria bacterium]|nr:hypothetical protein [Vicinamibacteria bacterium]